MPKALDDTLDAIRALLGTPNRPKPPPLSLFQMSELGRIPNVTQEVVPAYTSGRPLTDLASGFQSRRPRITKDVLAGLQGGSDQWYHNEPIRQQFIYELGDQAGNERFAQWASLMGANSNSAPVRPNVRNASLSMNRMLNGTLPIGDVNNYKEALDFIRANKSFLPSGYGSVAQATSLNNVLQYVRGEDIARIGERGAPLKIQNFTQNLLGNLSGWTGDRHEAFRFGVPSVFNKSTGKMEKQVFPSTAYPEAERLSRLWSSDVGLSPAEWQSARWMGGAPFTGVKSTDPSMAHAIEEVVYAAARRTGEKPADVFRRYFKEGGIVAVPGAIGAGAAMSGDTPADEEQY